MREKVMKSIDELKKIMKNEKISLIKKKDGEGNEIIVSNKVERKCSMEELFEAERILKNIIPTEYKQFLLQYNGATIFNYDDIDGLIILGTNDMIKYTTYSENTFEEDWNSNIIIFGKIIGEDSYLGFLINENNTYDIVDCYFEELPEEWNIINMSFDEFLYGYIKTGTKFWI